MSSSSTGLDMSLDEIIAKKRPSRGARTGGPTRTGGIVKRSGGPVRNPRSPQVRPRPYSSSAATTSSNLNASPEGKILVSNLAYKVTEADLWVTIIKKCPILYKPLTVVRQRETAEKIRKRRIVSFFLVPKLGFTVNNKPEAKRQPLYELIIVNGPSSPSGFGAWRF
ncbi:14719_t:CDS:1 [Funneliformis geosporum]|uniref:5151_t:CDS:1 n=1 Tax=Funneliformis geosporum TaxID=1117311 RepID=A0A9W4SXJ9_9GLOM|nr:14719_t:CDS:1 [Funneliformis geosporum]CAI2185012.1 5151_t:CDS:1 [Funneliformis geosporum]